MNRNFIEALLKGKWFIDPAFILNNTELIANIITGKTVIEQKDTDNIEKIALARGLVSSNGLSGAPAGSVSFIPVTGTLFKNDQECGPVGMQTIGDRLQAADNNPNISAHLLYIDSPGGTVDGTETFANLIKSAKKPVIALVDGMMASAALWIGSSAREIYASTEMDEIGSVGVLLSFMDVQPYFESLGVKFHKITADQSYDKTKMFDDLRAGKYQEYKDQILNPLAERFMEVVKTNRPGSNKDMLHGKMYFARDVVGSFIDGIKTIDEAIARAQELGREYDATVNPMLNKSKTEMKQFARVNKALGVDTLESVDEQVSLNEDQLQIIETALEQSETASSDLAAANAAKTTAEGALATANSTIASQKQEIDSLKAAAAGGGAKAIADTETADKPKNDGAASVVKSDASFVENLQAVEARSKEILGH